MQRWTTLGKVTVLAMIMAACGKTANTHDADVKALKDIEIQWNQDYASKDLDKIVAHYADDAVLMAPGSPVSSGKDAIQTALKQMISDPALALKFEASRVDVAKSGDVAFTQGSYTMDATDPQSKQVIHDHGSYVTTYRKQANGAWKAVADIATSEVPPPAPAPKHAAKSAHTPAKKHKKHH